MKFELSSDTLYGLYLRQPCKSKTKYLRVFHIMSVGEGAVLDKLIILKIEIRRGVPFKGTHVVNLKLVFTD